MTVDNQAGSGLNLRSGQSIDSAVIRLLENGVQVTVLGVSEDWLHVRVGDDIGYIRITGTSPRIPYTYGTPGISNAQITSRVTQARITKNCSGYSDPGNAARAVCSLFEGESFPFLGMRNGYAKIEVDGGDIWVKTSDVEIARGAP